jgi:hypothetical protein
VDFYSHWKIAQFALVAAIESVACRSINLSTDPGQMSHLIARTHSKWTAASTKTFI